MWKFLHGLYTRGRKVRVPLRQQLTATECGAACLAMILTHFGRNTTVAEVRETCPAGRDGLKAATIVAAARGYHLRARGFSAELTALPKLPLPSIIHWGFNHFVVLEAWNGRCARIADPAQGRLEIPAKEFEKAFTGIVLTFEPGAGFLRKEGSPTAGTHRRVLDLFLVSGTAGLLARILAASAAIQILSLVVPLLTKVIVDRVLPFAEVSMLRIVLGAVVLSVITQTFTSYARAIGLLRLRLRVDRQMMSSFVEHLMSLPLPFFDVRASGDLLLRLGSNGFLREVVSNQILSTLLDGTFLAGYTLLIYFISPAFCAAMLFLILLQALVIAASYYRVRPLAKREIAAKAQEQSFLVEVLKGMPLLKASGAEDITYHRWTDLFAVNLNASLSRSKTMAAFDATLFALRSVTPIALLWLGVYSVMNGTMTLGTLLAINGLATALTVPVANLLSSAQQLQLIEPHLERISDVIEAKSEPRSMGTEPLTFIRGRIEMRNVTFRYQNDGPEVLKDVSLKIRPGQKVAVVGRTGSGKSTLTKLLLGLYSPIVGTIYYDDIPLPLLDCHSLRSQVGVVLQEPFLFSGSIIDNITFGEPGALLERAMEVAKYACIHEDILAMPMAYETVISEGGENLSGGQRQRLAIARALYSSPEILILDEATSHLDVATEGQVDEHLTALACTRIVIAHRLSTIQNADEIVVLERGRVAQRGTHADLIYEDGPYRDMLRSQRGRTSEVEVAYS